MLLIFVFISCVGDLHMAGSTSRDSGLKETVTLKWCTPRTNSVGEWNSVKCFLLSATWQIHDFSFFLQNCITAQGRIVFLQWTLTAGHLPASPTSCWTVCVHNLSAPPCIFFLLNIVSLIHIFGNRRREAGIWNCGSTCFIVYFPFVLGLPRSICATRAAPQVRV